MKFFLLRRRWLAAIPMVLIVAAIFYVVNFPAAIGVSGTTRELPIYSVQRDQKMVSISFDAHGVICECDNIILGEKSAKPQIYCSLADFYSDNFCLLHFI